MCAASKHTDAVEANRTDCSMKTIADITVIALSIMTLVDRGVTEDSQLLTTLDSAAVTFFKNLHHRPANTKKTDLVLTHMPSSMTFNSSGFSTWADTITEDLAQNLSQEKFTRMEYIIRLDEEHVVFGDVDPSLNFIECATITA